MHKKKSRRVPPLSQKKSMKHTNQEFCRQKGPSRESPLQWKRHGTFSTSERDDRDWFCRTSGAVNARRSWWETLSSVNDTLPDGSKRRDHGEMMNPRAAGSAVFERRKKKNLQINIQLLCVISRHNFICSNTYSISIYFPFHLWCFITTIVVPPSQLLPHPPSVLPKTKKRHFYLVQARNNFTVEKK